MTISEYHVFLRAWSKRVLKGFETAKAPIFGFQPETGPLKPRPTKGARSGAVAPVRVVIGQIVSLED